MGLNDSGGEILYAGMRLGPQPVQASYLIRGRIAGKVQAACPGALERFLAERYLVYTMGKSCLYRGQVYHLPYHLRPVQTLTDDKTLLTAAGIPRPDTPPLAHFAAGVDVEIL